jgi:hypothetical protein
MGHKLLPLSQYYRKMTVGFYTQSPLFGNIRLSPILEMGLTCKEVPLTIIFTK